MNTPTSPADVPGPGADAERLDELVRAARAWLDDDPDPDTRAELAALVGSGDAGGLAARFDGTLAFGTAGLRGALGAGPNRMNRVVVQRAAAGVAAYLRASGTTGRVAIGYDARHKSDVFARDTADVLAGAGFTPLLLPRPLPTPVLAYAVRHLGAVAGIMVTASHNPPQDNGYKVYLGDGRQIVPPADAGISAEIAKVGRVTELPKGTAWPTLDDTLVDAYVERVASLVSTRSPRRLRLAYTPMHGVGRDVMLAVLARAGFDPPAVVPAQGDPDPDFPTVGFPNPEEPGALDLAVATAVESGADLVVANDPDADRCAVAVRRPDGTYRTLSGDELGALLGAHLLRRDPDRPGAFAATIVSSTLLGRLAAAAGVPYAETLTGFKWLSRVPDLRYAYEEAIGYCVDPDAVADKDGISAALLACELAATLAAEGRTLDDLLDEIAVAHGLHATRPLSVRVRRLAEREEMLDRLRADPPRTLAGLAVTSVDDLDAGGAGVPPTPGLRFRLGEQARIVVRPSGTEPKLKCYLEVVVPVETDVTTARERADERLTALAADLAKAAGFPA
ncbi:MAG: phospho-sugar mutase [Streptosporangiales bacterium]|nr:phospho-sugar mutase [Streptosporangiales bacterium]